MKCPFCQSELENIIDKFDFTYKSCRDEDCVVSEMPRFVETVSRHNIIISQKFIIGEFYVSIDCINKTTVIYKLVSCLLMSPITINSILEIDMSNPNLSLPKLQMLALLS